MESGGRFEEFAAGANVFSEGDTSDMRLPFVKVKRHRMYLLSEGEVALTAREKKIIGVKLGFISRSSL